MNTQQVDVLLVGGGVMSATLGMLLNKLDPQLSILMVERLEDVANESSFGWNNAGTGHAGYCELNYTPRNDEGNIEINRALSINANFEISLQFWSHLVDQGILGEPKAFINNTPHLSFVWGEENVQYLQDRQAAMSAHHLFSEMKISTDFDEISQWIPLIMNGRDNQQPVAATRVEHGADVDYGSLTQGLIKHLESQPNFTLKVNEEVEGINRKDKQSWNVHLKNKKTGKKETINSKFVFIGAGGAALPLLQAADIDESVGYGGFPVSGQWLVCKDPSIVSQHHAKVYGKAAIGAPPMSVPHLDTRIIEGEAALLFGPFAGFTTRFLKQGSSLDLFNSIQIDNLLPMMSVGAKNMDLTRYLISEAMQSKSERVETLKGYYPNCKDENWSLAQAGQRVQVIKKDENGRGILEFGTELVAAKDGSLAALLGASPGASVSVIAMVEVLERCFKNRLTQEWKDKLKEMIPSYGESLTHQPELLEKVRAENLSRLKLA